MPTTSPNAWVITDDDAFQIRREYSDANSRFFELYQIQDMPDETYAIAHGFVYLEDLSSEQIRDVLDCYGYADLEELRHVYNDNWRGVLAEIQFELDSGCFENLIPGLRYDSWEAARDFIACRTGIESEEIEYVGEDASLWRFIYKDGAWVEQNGRVVYETEEAE